MLRQMVYRVGESEVKKNHFLFSFSLTVLSTSQILEGTLGMSNQEFIMLLQMENVLGAESQTLRVSKQLIPGKNGYRP